MIPKLFIGAALAVFAPIAFAQDVEQPNIIMFLVDDLGWQDTSVVFGAEPTGFQQHFRTPHVARLARQGAKFSNAYAAAVCSPTRTSLLTGQNPARHRITNWTLYLDRDQSGKSERLGPPSGWKLEGLQPSDSLLPEQLRGQGYVTIHCGKAHFGAIGTPGSDPRNLGFDINISGHSAGAPGSYRGRDNFGNHPDGSHKLPWGVPGLTKYHGTNTHLSDALATEVIAAIDQATAAEKPFFLHMATYAVHTPIQEHPRFIESYRGRQYDNTEIDIPLVEAQYASMVEGFDAALGAILNRLDEIGQAANTLIIFTSDNGGLSIHARGRTWRGTGADTHNWPLRGGKGSAYEGGTRVPLIISWAQTDQQHSLQHAIPIQSNSTIHVPVICEDLMPTILAWSGIDRSKVEKISPSKMAPMDGVDLTPLLTDPDDDKAAQAIASRPLLFHYPHIWGPSGSGYSPHSALRSGRWKVIYFYEGATWELYDLETDQGEATNLAVENSEQLRLTSTKLIEQLKSLDALYPSRAQTGEPVQIIPPGD